MSIAPVWCIHVNNPLMNYLTTLWEHGGLFQRLREGTQIPDCKSVKHYLQYLWERAATAISEKISSEIVCGARPELHFLNLLFVYDFRFDYISCTYSLVMVKVKVTLVQALRLCTGRTAHRGSRGIAVFHDHGTRRGWGVSVTPWPLFTPVKNPVPIVQEAGWAPGTGAENPAPHRDSIPGPSSP